MRIKRVMLVVAMVFACAILAYPLTAGALVNWNKNATAVLSGGTNESTDYDAGGIERPMVIIDGTTYRMYYTGYGIASGVSAARILHASSSDGINWTPNHTTPIVPLGGSGAFDEKHNGFCWVIKDGSIYKMWYTGNSNAEPEDSNWQIGYATSDDGVTWVRYSDTPVLAKGSGSEWDSSGIGAPSVIKDGSVYKMWYTGWIASEDSEQYGFGYATSPDGITWTKHPGNPVLIPGNPGSWDSLEGGMPSVIKEGGLYRMWYYGIQSDSAPDRIGYAYSYNGIGWTKYDGNPVIMNGQIGSFDEYGAWDPVVVKDGNTYKMWYVGSSNCTEDGCWDQVGYAESYAYDGPNPLIGDANVYTQNTSGGKQIAFGLAPEGPGPLDVNELYVTGPNGVFFIFRDSNIANMVGQQVISGASNVADFAPYAGTYTFTITANNGATASRQLTLTPATIPYPVDGPSDLDRRIELDGTYTTDNVYISGTTPTFKWKPSAGTGYYYRVRVNDLKGVKLWFMSDPVLGSQVDGEGRMSASVPQGMLQPNTPYQYQIEVLDTDQYWSAHNRSRSTTWKFYTGTKGADFLFNPYVFHMQSFRAGEQAVFGVNVYNLAPWDISSGTTPFRVETSGVTTPLYFQYTSATNYQNLGYYQYAPADYSAGLVGEPDPVQYDFFISDLASNWDTASRTFTPASVPQVTKDSMQPGDNSYLDTLQPTLTWQSLGTGYKYRVRMHTWNNFPVWVSSWRDGAALGSNMSEAVPAGILQPGPYRWFVEVQDAAGADANTRTRSQYLTINVGGGGAQGRADYIMTAWGSDKNKLASAFNNYGAGNGLYSNDGTQWTKLTDWVPDGMGAWGDGNLAALFTAYGAGYNGLWNYNGASWSKMTDWILDEGEAWGGNKFAASFTAYGLGNGLYSYDGTNWTKLTDWIPSRLCGWGGTHLAAVFSAYGPGNDGIWSYDGTNWTKLTDWIPDGMIGWGTDQLAAKFSSYGVDNGIYTFNGTTWTKLTDWVSSGDMVPWGANQLSAVFSAYGSGNGLYSWNGTVWTRLTDWVPDGMLAVGTTTLGAAFSNFDTGNGVWGYNGTWSKLTDWIPDTAVAWGTDAFTGVFSQYGADSGLWHHTASWNRLTDWIPAEELD